VNGAGKTTLLRETAYALRGRRRNGRASPTVEISFRHEVEAEEDAPSGQDVDPGGPFPVARRGSEPPLMHELSRVARMLAANRPRLPKFAGLETGADRLNVMIERILEARFGSAVASEIAAQGLFCLEPIGVFESEFNAWIGVRGDDTAPVYRSQVEPMIH